MFNNRTHERDIKNCIDRHSTLKGYLKKCEYQGLQHYVDVLTEGFLVLTVFAH